MSLTDRDIVTKPPKGLFVFGELMFKKREPCRGTAQFVAGSLTLTIGNDYELQSATAVPLSLDWYYEPYIPATEDEPACPEWLELDEIQVLKPTIFGNEAGGVFVTLKQFALLDNFLTTKQYEDLLTMFREGMKDE